MSVIYKIYDGKTKLQCDLIRKKSVEYGRKHRKETNLRFIKWVNKNRERRNSKLRDWRKRNKEEILERERARAIRSKDKILFGKRIYRIKNREKLNADLRLKRKTIPLYRLRMKLDRIRRRSIGDYISIKVLQSVYESNILRYGSLTCELCKLKIDFKKDSIDHKIPLSKGGSNDFSNLQVTHLTCNLKKGSKIIK